MINQQLIDNLDELVTEVEKYFREEEERDLREEEERILRKEEDRKYFEESESSFLLQLCSSVVNGRVISVGVTW